MSRFSGSIFAKSRRYEFSLLESGKEFSKGKKRAYAPGQHGQKRKKLSNYGQQLQEKQKIRFMYGITERQFRNTYKKSKSMKGIAGTNLLIALESRLDNLVYRLGLASTRAGARQLVNHNHVLVNNKKADIPSYQVKIGDIISLKEDMMKNEKVLEAIQGQTKTLDFVKFDKAKFQGTYIRFPERTELNADINESLVIEWYNRLI